MSEKKSRMDRNAQLHQELLAEKEERIVTKELSPFANQLNNLDNQFERMDLPLEASEHYQSPLHVRNERYVPKQEVPIEPIVPEQIEEEPVMTESEEGFSNNFLEEFIDEVKQYNVEKGYRNTVDTKANVLSGINGWQSNLRPFGHQKSDEPLVTPSNEPIISDEPIIEDEPIVEEDTSQETIMMEVQRLAELDEPLVDEKQDIDETLTYEIEELEELDIQEEKVQPASKIDKVINFFLYLLIAASIVVILIIVYIVLSVNGII
ncbi:MAG: hypothetical protein GX775_04810 [Erysipelothrix sp.]|nr:hypothetical protein [Erysipelothrix sp.]